MSPPSARPPTAVATTAAPRTSAPSPIACIATTATARSPTSPREAGIDLPEGRGLGVLIAELTGDNRPDIYVANDSSACWLFANRGDLRFEEIGEESGVARDGDGEVLSGMGVAQGDLDGDGLLDLVVANFYERSTIAFRAQGMPRGLYRDASSWLGLKAATRRVVGFGLLLVDFDGDGRVDLLQTNGHVLDRERLGTPFAMPPTLLRNTGIPLEDASATAGPWFRQAALGRGLAVADLDGDGRPDVVAGALDAPAAVLRNTSEGGHHLGLELVDRAGRPAFGATVRVTAGGRILSGSLAGGGSYLVRQPAAGLVRPGASNVGQPHRGGLALGFDRRSGPSRPLSPAGGLRLRQGTGRTISLIRSGWSGRRCMAIEHTSDIADRCIAWRSGAASSPWSPRCRRRASTCGSTAGRSKATSRGATSIS